MTTAAFIAAVEVLTGPLRSPHECAMCKGMASYAGVDQAAHWIWEHREALAKGEVVISNLTGQVFTRRAAEFAFRRSYSNPGAIVVTRRLWPVYERHVLQLVELHRNATPEFKQDVYERYCEYCLNGVSIRSAWESAYEDARALRRIRG